MCVCFREAVYPVYRENGFVFTSAVCRKTAWISASVSSSDSWSCISRLASQ